MSCNETDLIKRTTYLTCHKLVYKACTRALQECRNCSAILEKITRILGNQEPLTKDVNIADMKEVFWEILRKEFMPSYIH